MKEAIKNLNELVSMGFITYEQYLHEMMQLASDEDSKAIFLELNKLIESDYYLELQREFQDKVDAALRENDVINDIVKKYDYENN